MSAVKRPGGPNSNTPAFGAEGPDEVQKKAFLSKAQKIAIAKSALLTSLPLPVAAAVALLAPLFMLRGPEAKERLAKLSSEERKELEDETDEKKEEVIVEKSFNIVSIDKEKGKDFNTSA